MVCMLQILKYKNNKEKKANKKKYNSISPELWKSTI